ncbi:MAG: hypothetical protein JW929_04250 [Anaerolineales bacterium]|nr:hypothetical protein [Anaerolineales bacterium]
MRKRIAVAAVVSLLLGLVPFPALATGYIFTLNAWGGWAPDTPVTVQSTIYTDDNLGPSNLHYTISLGSTIYATHTTNLPRMNRYETRNDQWETVNSGWPEGDYTITVCWSTGNATNCNIAGPLSTVRHFVPTLGWGLTAAALGILLAGLWHRRKEFEPAAERIRP